MLIPMDRPTIDARNIREAATQTVSSGFTATHNNKRVLLLTAGASNSESDATTPIQAGVRDGQLLTIIVIADPSGRYVSILDSGTAAGLKSRWKVSQGQGVGHRLEVCWETSSSQWTEIARVSGGLTMYGLHSHSEGVSCHADGDGAHAEGGQAQAIGNYSHAEGNNTDAVGVFSHAMGYYSKADEWASFAQADGKFATQGDAQHLRFVCRETINFDDTDPHVIGINDTGIGPVIPADTAWTFRAEVIGIYQPNGSGVISYIINGCIKRIGNTTTLLAQTSTPIHRDNPLISVVATINDTTDSLDIEATDAGGDSEIYLFQATIHVAHATF